LACSDSLQHQDCLFQLLAFGAEFDEHLVDVHTAQVYRDWSWATVDRGTDSLVRAHSGFSRRPPAMIWEQQDDPPDSSEVPTVHQHDLF